MKNCKAFQIFIFKVNFKVYMKMFDTKSIE